MTVQLNSLRVSAEMDASQYAAGAAQKVAADKAMTASSTGVAAAVTQTQQKISQSGDVLARLSRQYVDGFASAQKMESALNQLAKGVETGKISITQTGPILDGIYQKYGKTADAASFTARGQTELGLAVAAANSRFVAAKPAVEAHGSALGIGNTQTMALTHSIRSFAEQMALGIPVTQAAVSELNHLSYAMAGEDGLLAALKKAGPGLLAGILTPIGALVTGFGVVAVAAGAYYLATREASKSLAELLKEERQAIDDISKSYDLAKVSSDNYNKSAGFFAEAAARKGQSDLGKAATLQDADVLNSLTRFVPTGFQPSGHGVTPTGQLEAKPQYSAFAGPIDAFARNRDYDALAKGVHDITAQNPGLQETGDKILNIAKVGDEAAVALKEAADTLARINSRAPSQADSELARQYREANDVTLTWLQRQRDASLSGIGARSPEELRQAAIAAETAKPTSANESDDVRQFRIASAGALAYQQALHALTEAQDQRKRSLDQTLASTQLDVSLIGKTKAEIEGLTLAAQLEAQIREEAARNHTKADEAEIALTRQKAAEYGQLRAAQEARNTIFNQSQNLEVMRAEIGLTDTSHPVQESPVLFIGVAK